MLCSEEKPAIFGPGRSETSGKLLGVHSRQGGTCATNRKSQVLFDLWRDDEIIADEAVVPDVSARAQFNLEVFSDSSWTDGKITRQSTSSGCSDECLRRK